MLNWTELKGEWKCRLRYEFCRVQLNFPPLPNWIGMSIFVHDKITSVDNIHATYWFLPFKPKIVEVKYHYSVRKWYNPKITEGVNPLWDKLISFSVRRDSLETGGFNDLVKDLDGKTIEFTKCRVNDQKLEGFDGEVYPIWGEGEMICL